jgi:hypothetical protein
MNELGYSSAPTRGNGSALSTAAAYGNLRADDFEVIQLGWR